MATKKKDIMFVAMRAVFDEGAIQGKFTASWAYIESEDRTKMIVAVPELGIVEQVMKRTSKRDDVVIVNEPFSLKNDLEGRFSEFKNIIGIITTKGLKFGIDILGNVLREVYEKEFKKNKE